MLHAFLINPAAGKPGMARRLGETVRSACERLELDFAVTFTDSPGDAVRLTRYYADSGQSVRLYACGGDGTLNQVVQAAAGRENLAITNLPAGTGNDFLRIFAPGGKEGFLDLDALVEGPQAALDLIDCNGTLALNIACAGIDARVARDVHRFSPVSSKGAYVLSLINNVLLKGTNRPMRVTMGGQVWDEPIALVCVCNGRYYGGGFMPVGEAMPDDGILDALLVPGVSLFTFARLVGDYAAGRYARHPDVVKPYHGPGPIILESDAPITMALDGEIVEDTRFTLRLSEKKVNFFWPKGVSYQVETGRDTGGL